jgi:hypothetical protein
MCCPHPAQVHLEQVLQVTFLHILTADSLLVHFLCSKYRSDDVTAMMLSQIMTLTSQLPQLSSLRNFYFHVKKASRLPEHTGCYATRPHVSSTTMLYAWPVETRHIQTRHIIRNQSPTFSKSDFFKVRLFQGRPDKSDFFSSSYTK